MKLKVILGICLLLLLIMAYSCESDQRIEFDRYYSSGMGVYEVHCQNCHGAHGEGLADLIPPLTDTVFIKKHKDVLACMVRSGMMMNFKVAGKSFYSRMPANANLSPIEVAQVVTYVGNSFGNKLGLVNSDDVVADIAKCAQ